MTRAWLRNIPFKLDITQAEEKDWVTANGDALLSQAIAACIHPGIGLTSATKVLHLKRPYLVPILDRFVAEMMGVNLPDNPSVAQRVAIGQRLAAAIRREGRRNIQVLRRIQEELISEGIERTLIRISTASFGIRIRPLAFLAASGRSASGFRPEKAGVAAPMSIQPATTPLIRRVPPAEQNTRIGAQDSGTVAGPRTAQIGGSRASRKSWRTDAA